MERSLLASSVELRNPSGGHGKNEGAQGQQKQGPSELGTFSSGQESGLPQTYSQGGDLGEYVRADSSRTSEGRPVFGLEEAHGRTQT